MIAELKVIQQNKWSKCNDSFKLQMGGGGKLTSHFLNTRQNASKCYPLQGELQCKSDLYRISTAL